MDIYDFIDDWGLDRDDLSFKKYTRTQISKIARELTSIYSEGIKSDLGRKHLSLYESISTVEGRKPLSCLATPLLFSKQIWLPDPLYSCLSTKTKGIWNKLPESGDKSINGSPRVYMPWNNYWSTRSSERISYLDETVPTLVKNLLQVKPLVENGFVYLFPWELVVSDFINDIKTSVLALQDNTEVLEIVTRKYTQEEYSLGARTGPIGISFGANPPSGVNKGDPLWLGDPSNVLYAGVLNTLLTAELSSDFINSLKGDRLIHDFIRSGEYNPVIENVTNIGLPNLNEAL